MQQLHDLCWLESEIISSLKEKAAVKQKPTDHRTTRIFYGVELHNASFTWHMANAHSNKQYVLVSFHESNRHATQLSVEAKFVFVFTMFNPIACSPSVSMHVSLHCACSFVQSAHCAPQLRRPTVEAWAQNFYIVAKHNNQSQHVYILLDSNTKKHTVRSLNTERTPDFKISNGTRPLSIVNSWLTYPASTRLHALFKNLKTGNQPDGTSNSRK